MVQDIGKNSFNAGANYALKGLESNNSEISGLAGLANYNMSRNIGSILMNKGFEMAKNNENEE